MRNLITLITTAIIICLFFIPDFSGTSCNSAMAGNYNSGGFYETFAGDTFAIVHEGQLGAFTVSYVSVLSKSKVNETTIRLVCVDGDERIITAPLEFCMPIEQYRKLVDR